MSYSWISKFLIVSPNIKHKFIPHLLVSMINVSNDFSCLLNDKRICYVQNAIQSILCEIYVVEK